MLKHTEVLNECLENKNIDKNKRIQILDLMIM